MKLHVPSHLVTRSVMCLIAVIAGGWLLYDRSWPTMPEELPMAEQTVFSLDSLVVQLRESGQSYLPFLSVPTLRAGLYALQAGATDGQAPHNKDEVYYVLEGRARITIDGAEHPVAQGDVIFVEAFAEHRFHDIEESLLLLVFFSEADP